MAMPYYEHEVTQRITEMSSFRTDHALLMESFLRSINEKSLWSVKIYRPGAEIFDELEDMKGHNSYLIFTWPGVDDDDVLTNLIAELEEIKIKSVLNHRERFLLVITDAGTKSPSETAITVLEELWSNYMILDVVVLVPDIQFPSTSSGINKLLLYTWFPYHESGEHVILINEWVMECDGSLLNDSDLFPKKNPYKFKTSPLRVATIDMEPFVVLEGTYTNENNEISYNINGPEIELLHDIMRHMNLSFYFLSPPPSDMPFVDQMISSIKMVVLGEADVAIGGLPLIIDAAIFADYTMPYFRTGVSWYVPCPRPIPRMEKIARIFHVTTWLMMGTVLLVVVSVTWGSARLVGRRESHCYRSLSRCSLNTYAVFLGVPVPDLPRTSPTRLCFILFVWYSFAVCILFQAFFTSILVDPGFVDQIRSFEELISSGIEYGYSKDMHEYYYPTDLHLYGADEVMKHGQDCSDYKQCLSRVINKGDFATLRSEMFAEYLVKTTMPRRINPLCSLDSTFKIYMLTIYLPKESFLLDFMDRIISRIIESGIADKKVNDFKHMWRYQTAPDADNDNAEDADESYFVFTTNHLTIAFCVLIFGYGSSFLMFLGELLSRKIMKYINLSK
jgi:hypothetical protein